MRKEYIQKIVTRHWNKIKVFWWIFAIVVMMIAVKTYVNYSAIVDEIENINGDIESVEQKTAYAKNFYLKYVDSEYYMYFLSHKNNILFDGEYIIKITDNPTENENQDKENIDKVHHETPQESRQRFIKSKIN